MAEANFDQQAFTQGELDPRTQGRADWIQYYKSAKQIRNALVIPQGGVQHRFGLTYVDNVPANPVNPLYCELSTLIYDNNAVYLLVWTALQVRIYLENVLVATVVTQFTQEDVPDLRFAQVLDRLIVVHPYYQPQQLTRAADAANVITGFVGAPNNELTITNALVVGTVYPARFTTTGALPTTNPQIYANRDYFVLATGANSVRIFSTSTDAINNVNFYTVTNAGAGVNTLFTQNTWAIANIAFTWFPAYDFNGGYNALTFTPSAVTGVITITASAPIFTAQHVGGLYTGNGGIARITGFVSNVVVNAFTIQDFASVAAIRGDLSFLGEPAWSTGVATPRFWPRTVSFFQNRLVFAGSPSIPNGVWLSVSFEAFNFDDSERLDDNAISWYPSNGSITFIRAITSARSLLFHTNTGNLSTPVAQEAVLTPTNFTLTEQNKFGVSDIQPIFLDNQILFTDISGNNVIVMIWEFTQSSYVVNNKSVAASTLINKPVDMASFAVPEFIDGFFAFFVNQDGTLAIHQTLLEEEVKAWSLASTSQIVPNGAAFDTINARIVRVQVGNNRCWFTIQRWVPTVAAPVAITGFSAPNNTLTAVGHGMPIQLPVQVTFTTTGVLPTTVPQIVVGTNYWAVATTPNQFQVYGSQSDATNRTNVYSITNAGVNSNVTITLINAIYIEELDFNVFTDSSRKYNFAAATNTLTNLAHLNGCRVQVVGDGFVLQDRTVAGGQITIERNVLTAQVGTQTLPTLVPLPVTLPQTFGMLYRPKHIRQLYLQVFETLGITVQGITVPELEVQSIIFGQVPVPQTGVFEVPIMEGWNGFDFDLTIQQPLPLPMTILALSYRLEV